MNKYESYQDTDNWYGCIPCSWENHRIKRLFALRDERSYLPLSEVNLISLYSSIGVRQHSDIEHTTGNRARNADGYKIVHRDDIIVNILLCWMGAIGRSDYDGVTSPAYDVYMPRKGVNSQYYHYLFRTTAFSGECYKAGKGIMAMRWRTYSPQFMDITVPVPPRAEQDQIVRFLDWKVSEINKLIGIRRKEIQELEELKAYVIDKTVIHGLHGSAEIHNNDIRWDIDYPSTWKLERLRNLFTFRKGLSITKANLEPTGIPVISYGQVHSKKNSMVGLNDELFKYVNPSYLKTDPSALVGKGDFIFADTSEDLDGSGNCAYIDRDGKIFAGYHSVIAHPKGSTNNKYFAYLFKSPTWRYQIRKKVNAVKVFSITQQILKDVFLLVPPQNEQQEIVQYLDSTCSKIDSLIESTHKKIAELTEMKSVIISEAVTGKIDVRNVTVPEYEHVDDIYDVNNEDSEETEETETDGEEA